MKIPDELLDYIEFEKVSASTPSEFPYVKAIRPLAPCDDCGMVLEKQRRVDIRYCTTGKPHWRGKCNICGKYSINNEGFERDGDEYRRYVHDSAIMSGSRRKKYK